MCSPTRRMATGHRRYSVYSSVCSAEASLAGQATLVDSVFTSFVSNVKDPRQCNPDIALFFLLGSENVFAIGLLLIVFAVLIVRLCTEWSKQWKRE